MNCGDANWCGLFVAAWEDGFQESAESSDYLPPLDRLFHYSASENIYNRLVLFLLLQDFSCFINNLLVHLSLHIIGCFGGQLICFDIFVIVGAVVLCSIGSPFLPDEESVAFRYCIMIQSVLKIEKLKKVVLFKSRFLLEGRLFILLCFHALT